MTDEIELLSNPGKFGVVKLPGRKFPGLVLQGDTLNTLVEELKRALIEMKNSDFSKAFDRLEEVTDLLIGARNSYEVVCATRELSLPYVNGSGSN